MKQLILGSESPRRARLLRDMGFDFKMKTSNINEVIDPALTAEQMAISLAEQKNRNIETSENEVVLTADTIVALGDTILSKPKDVNEGTEMLTLLSGKTHQVITGVCIRQTNQIITSWDITEVKFKSLDQSEIIYYLENFKPYDKAGAYGIQEWLGQIGIERIRGSYYNVVGLPTHLVFQILTENFHIRPDNYS